MRTEPRLKKGRLPRRWRLVAFLAGLLLGIEVLWVLGAYFVLNTNFLKSRLNWQPEKLILNWESGASWVPGRIHLEGFTIRGQGRRDQWYGEAGQADLRIKLLPLLRRNLLGESVRMRGVAFRLRPRLDAIPSGEVNPAHLPSIPGLSNPPKKAPAFKTNAPSAKQWVVAVSDIHIAELREIWISESRLAGTGTLLGSMHHELRGPFRASVSSLDMALSMLAMKGITISTNLHWKLNGTLHPIRFKVDKGPALFERFTAETQLEGGLETCQLLAPHLGQTDCMNLEGGGNVDASIHFDRGKFLPSTRVRIGSPSLAVHVENLIVAGDGNLQIDVTGDTEKPISTMTVRLKDLSLNHKIRPAVASAAGELKLVAVAWDPHLPRGFKDVALDLDCGPITLSNVAILNGFLSPHFGGGFLQGSVLVNADYKRQRNGSGRGQLQIYSDIMAFKFGGKDFAGCLDVMARFGRSRPRFVELNESHVILTNVLMSGVRNRKPEGWHARVDLRQGLIALDDPGTIQADLKVSVLDTRPLFALLDGAADMPGWVKWIPTLKNLQGGASLSISPAEVRIRDLYLRGSATEIMAQMKLVDGHPDGILYVRYGLISAGFDFRNGERHWTILAAKQEYQRHLQEMGLEAPTQPEADR